MRANHRFISLNGTWKLQGRKELPGKDISANWEYAEFSTSATVPGNLELELEKSLAPIKQDEDYFQRSAKTATEILCPLNQTAVIAGQKDLTYTSSGPSGYAFLRHIPVINWFTSSEEEQSEEMLLLILVSPRIANSNVQMTSIPSDETREVEPAVSRSIEEKNEKIREQESRSWFEKMFTW